MASNSKAREKEILRAVDLIGWIAVAERLKTEEDIKILDSLKKKQVRVLRVRQSKALKKAGITL